MGNANNAKCTTNEHHTLKSVKLQPRDLPPAFTHDSINDRELLTYVDILSENTQCASIIKASKKLNNDQLNNIVDENECEWDKTLFYVCAMTFLDKQMYECIVERQRITIDQLVHSFEGIANRYQNNKLYSKKELSNNRVAAAAFTCTREISDSWNTFKNRLEHISYDVALQEYSDLCNQSASTNACIQPNDTSEMIRHKSHSAMYGPCNSLVVQPDQVTGNNEIGHAVKIVSMGFCLVSQLCANEIKACLERNSFSDCLFNDPYGNIMQCADKYNKHLK
jgi:hypothetical protein